MFLLLQVESNQLELERLQQLRIKDVVEIQDFHVEKVRDRKK